MSMYPTELPVARIRNIITILRSGEIGSQKVQLAHDIWLVQGFAQATIIGTPTSQGYKDDNENAIELLEKILAQINTIEEKSKYEMMAQKEIVSGFIKDVNWNIILKWALTTLVDLLVE